jgi:hypothetical protein
MKRERLEDLGRIFEKLCAIIEEDQSPMYRCESKHSVDQFVEIYKDEEKLEDLHNWLRFHKEKLEEIYYIARGDLDL